MLYAQLRRDGFCSVVKQACGEVKVLEVQTVDDESKQKLDDQQQSLEQWLRELVPPVGVLASADLRASPSPQDAPTRHAGYAQPKNKRP